MQTECMVDMDILILRAVRQILRYSNTFLQDKVAREKSEEDQLIKKLDEINKNKEHVEINKYKDDSSPESVRRHDEGVKVPSESLRGAAG